MRAGRLYRTHVADRGMSFVRDQNGGAWRSHTLCNLWIGGGYGQVDSSNVVEPGELPTCGFCMKRLASDAESRLRG